VSGNAYERRPWLEQSNPPPIGLAELDHKLARAYEKVRREYGRMSEKHLELWMHPVDLREIARSMLYEFDGDIHAYRGLKVIDSTEVEPGHPVLRSTWSWTL